MVKHEDLEIVAMLQEMNLHGMDWQGGTDKGTDHKYTEVYARLWRSIGKIRSTS